MEITMESLKSDLVKIFSTKCDEINTNISEFRHYIGIQLTDIKDRLELNEQKIQKQEQEINTLKAELIATKQDIAEVRSSKAAVDNMSHEIFTTHYLSTYKVDLPTDYLISILILYPSTIPYYSL